MKKQNKETFKSLKSSLEKNSKILIICSSNSEIEDVYDELLGFLNEKKIVRFYDREILPYDHFSTPDDVIKKRFNEIQKIENISHILITKDKLKIECDDLINHEVFVLVNAKDCYENKY